MVEVRTGHVFFAIFALALGGFAIGTTEFVTMGLLPDIGEAINEPISTTGHIVTAYALGVVVGAPVIVSLGARLPRRELAVGLILALGAGSVATAVASNYWSIMLARFIAGLPHGAFFGVASLLAASLVPPERKGRAVSGVMIGLSAATVAGVPASTWMGQNLGWRSAYWLVLAFSVAAALLILAFVPHQPGNTTATINGELRALKNSQVLFAAAAGMIGFGGIFAMYSYIAPIVTDVVDLSRNMVPWFLLFFGIGSVFGSWLAGRLAEISVERSIIGGLVCLAAGQSLFTVVGTLPILAAALVTSFGILGSVLAITFQIRLMHAAGDAEMLGAALNHSALNIGNGLGAWLGSLVIAGGFGLLAPSAVGAGLAVLGLAIFVWGLRVSGQSHQLA